MFYFLVYALLQFGTLTDKLTLGNFYGKSCLSGECKIAPKFSLRRH